MICISASTEWRNLFTLFGVNGQCVWKLRCLTLLRVLKYQFYISIWKIFHMRSVFISGRINPTFGGCWLWYEMCLISNTTGHSNAHFHAHQAIQRICYSRLKFQNRTSLFFIRNFDQTLTRTLTHIHIFIQMKHDSCDSSFKRIYTFNYKIWFGLDRCHIEIYMCAKLMRPQNQ